MRDNLRSMGRSPGTRTVTVYQEHGSSPFERGCVSDERSSASCSHSRVQVTRIQRHWQVGHLIIGPSRADRTGSPPFLLGTGKGNTLVRALDWAAVVNEEKVSSPGGEVFYLAEHYL